MCECACVCVCKCAYTSVRVCVCANVHTLVCLCVCMCTSVCMQVTDTEWLNVRKRAGMSSRMAAVAIALYPGGRMTSQLFAVVKEETWE